VYCHNPSPFYRVSWREAWHSPAFALFTLFYGALYGINIRRNNYIVVQQEWLRDAFVERYLVAPHRVIVSHPILHAVSASRPARPVRVFVYPTLARPFKNVELIGEAVRRLEREPGWNGEVRVTIDPADGRYARWLYRRYGDLRSLHFIGRQDRAGMRQLYAEADCLIFPSRLETWGLPISEAKAAGLPLVVADLPYARETVGTYDRVTFVPVGDGDRLAEILLATVSGAGSFSSVTRAEPAAPFAHDWPALLHLLIACT
jgi:glycosyltransferase involved in cell wall biosynthesis